MKGKIWCVRGIQETAQSYYRDDVRGGRFSIKSRKPKRASHTGISGINLRVKGSKGGERKEGERGRGK
jgi:hypothetical protein